MAKIQLAEKAKTITQLQQEIKQLRKDKEKADAQHKPSGAAAADKKSPAAGHGHAADHHHKDTDAKHAVSPAAAADANRLRHRHRNTQLRPLLRRTLTLDTFMSRRITPPRQQQRPRPNRAHLLQSVGRSHDRHPHPMGTLILCSNPAHAELIERCAQISSLLAQLFTLLGSALHRCKTAEAQVQALRQSQMCVAAVFCQHQLR